MEKTGQKSQKEADGLAFSVSERVKTLRFNKKWTLEELSAASGVSRSMISEIERGRANPTLAVTVRLANAFDLSLDELLGRKRFGESIEVIRSDNQNYVFREEAHCYIRTLSPLRLEKRVEFYEIKLQAGHELKSEPHYHNTKEILTVQKGKVEVLSGNEKKALGKGDTAHYPADVLHNINNIGDSKAHLFLVVIYD